MRVLAIGPFPPDHDGIASYTRMICSELRRQGSDVAVLASHAADPAPPEVIGVLGSPLGSSAALSGTARAFRPDLAHLQFAVATYGARFVFVLRLLARLRRAGIPVVVTMHEITRDVDTLGPVGRRAYRALAARSDRIIVHTESARRAYHRHVPDGPDIDVVAHPRARLPASQVSADELRRRHGLGEEQIVLSFGFIHVDKGLDDLLRAIGRLEREGVLDGVRIVLAGEVRRREGVLRPFEARDHLYLRRLRAIIDEQAIGHRVRFTGYVPAAEVRPWFESAALAVLPYRRIEQSGAGSLASGAGTPLLTTTVGELEHLSTFPPVPPRDPVALAEGIRRALQSEHGGAAAPQAEIGGDLAQVARRTAEVYEHVLAEGRA